MATRQSSRRRSAMVLQFRVALRDVKPTVWRRIVVPSEYTFWDLHVAIQDALGWLDYHLHEWEIVKGARRTTTRFGIPADDPMPGETVWSPDWEATVLAWLCMPGHRALYRYDFGDGWELDVALEAMLAAEPGKYPRCVDGARAGPPEDVGGAWGYTEFCEAMADPSHPEHETQAEWIGGSWDPERFEAPKVKFDNPRVRWRKVFGRRASRR